MFVVKISTTGSECLYEQGFREPLHVVRENRSKYFFLVRLAWCNMYTLSDLHAQDTIYQLSILILVYSQLCFFVS